MTTNHERIEQLISQTHDPVVQATLLVLSKIDYALDANTEATQAIAKDLSAHREEFKLHAFDDAKRLAGIRGGWWAGIALLSAINVMGGYLITKHFQEGENQESAINDLRHRMTVLETHHQIATDRIKIPDSNGTTK